MDDKYMVLGFLLFLFANLLVGLVQKARAQEKRRQRPGGKPEEKPAVPGLSAPEARPRRMTTVRRQAPTGRRVPHRQAAGQRQPSKRPSRTQEVLRDWAKRLEEALQPAEPAWQPPGEPQPEKLPISMVPRIEETAFGEGPRRAPRPADSRRAPYRRPTPSVAFLGQLHPNPVVNGIILSEILSRPLALREIGPRLLH